MAGKLKITLKKSRISRSKKQRQILDGLGLRKINQMVERVDTPSIRGMIKKMEFALDVEEC